MKRIAPTIVKVHGGLGNQMFQYAFSRALSAAGCDKVRYDIRSYNINAAHQGLEIPLVFRLTMSAAPESAINEALKWCKYRFVRFLLKRPAFRPLRPKSYVLEEPGSRVRVSTGGYYEGYWQAEQYFDAIREQLAAEFQFKGVISGDAAGIREMIKGSRSVAVHIRRGDYVESPTASKFHGVCEPDYYRRASEFIRSKIKSPRFFIFSDDILWARHAKLVTGDVVFVDVNRGRDSFKDMLLMSECRHSIIANSSFSWWAAWLNETPARVVVAPARWYANEAIERSGRTQVPRRWVRL